MELLASLDGHAGRCIAGVDEAGRGPLAGDVVAAAVVPGAGFVVEGINDSKKLTEKQRERLYEEIIAGAECYAVGRAGADEIDRLNILQASLLAMRRALDGLKQRPDLVYVDGMHCPRIRIGEEVLAIPRGDGRIMAIAAASIIAKVERDHDMMSLDAQYPGYGFARHKGYPTRVHFEALARLGPCEAHRRSFSPVARHLSHSDLVDDRERHSGNRPGVSQS